MSPHDQLMLYWSMWFEDFKASGLLTGGLLTDATLTLTVSGLEQLNLDPSVSDLVHEREQALAVIPRNERPAVWYSLHFQFDNPLVRQAWVTSLKNASWITARDGNLAPSARGIVYRLHCRSFRHDGAQYAFDPFAEFSPEGKAYDHTAPDDTVVDLETAQELENADEAVDHAEEPDGQLYQPPVVSVPYNSAFGAIL